LIVAGLAWFFIMRQVFSARMKAIRDRDDAAGPGVASEPTESPRLT
jgi:hypothetical protein